MMWHATMLVTLVNGVAGFTEAAVSAGLPSGQVAIAGDDVGSYTISVGLEGRGLTEDLAKQELAKLTIEHSDVVKDGRLVLDTTVKHEPLLTVPLPTGGNANIDLPANWNANITEALPSFLSYDLDAGTASGSVSAADLHGATASLSSASGEVSASELTFDTIDLGAASGTVQGARLTGREISVGTSSGSVQLSGVKAGTLEAGTASGSTAIQDATADVIDLSSSSGSISLAGATAGALHAGTASGNLDASGTFDNIDVGASSGSVMIEATPAATGTYDFGAASGSLKVKLGTGDGRAFDVEASTASGSVDISLPDSEQVGDDSPRQQHVRTVGFDDAAIQTVITLDTSSGSIDVTG
jgi:hypothetical protein